MDHLSASELASLVDCKPNQRSRMAAWLDKHRWVYVLDSHGLPKVARGYYERKMGISDNKAQSKYADTPDFSKLAG